MQNLNKLNLEEFVKAITFVLSDNPKKQVDTLLFFSRSYGDSSEIVNLAVNLVKEGKANSIMLAEQDGEKLNGKIRGEANPGKELYIKSFVERGIDRDNIIVCPVLDPKVVGLHTSLEGQILIHEAKRRKLKTGIVVAYPHQLLRIALGLLKSLENEKFDFKFWNAFPKQVDWSEKTTGSQGMLLMDRSDHIDEETKRIIAYQEKGDLTTFQEFFDYIKNRDLTISNF